MEDAFIAPRESRQGRTASYAFLAGNGVSLVGNTLVMVALPWFVLETTGSASQTGVIGMTAALPALFAGLFGGMLVDRTGGRRMSIVSDVFSGAAVMLVPLLYQAGGLSFPVLVALVFAGAALDIPGVTARRALLPELAEGAGMRQEAMASWFESMQSVAFILGPAIAGGLIALIGSVNLLWITAGGFFFSALCVGLFAPDVRHSPEDGSTAATGALAEMKEGFRAMASDSLLVWLAFGLTAMNFLVTPFWGVALPVVIEERFGLATRLGLLFTALGLGSVSGAIAYGTWGHLVPHRRRLLYLIGVTSFCAMTWLFVLDLPYWVLLGIVFAEGLLSGPINPLLVNVRLERIPPFLRGRVFATFSGLAAAAIPLGMLGTGWVLDVAGLDRGLALIAMLASIVTLGLWLARPLHDMDQPAAPLNEHPGADV
jgi:MFS family permease